MTFSLSLSLPLPKQVNLLFKFWQLKLAKANKIIFSAYSSSKDSLNLQFYDY
jgi:hypothetical protein